MRIGSAAFIAPPQSLHDEDALADVHAEPTNADTEGTGFSRYKLSNAWPKQTAGEIGATFDQLESNVSNKQDSLDPARPRKP